MADHGLKLPPHMRAHRASEAPPKAAASRVEAEEVAPRPLPDRATDLVSVSTPLGTVTCPPGRLRLNLMSGGMPKRAAGPT